MNHGGLIFDTARANLSCHSLTLVFNSAMNYMDGRRIFNPALVLSDVSILVYLVLIRTGKFQIITTSKMVKKKKVNKTISLKS